MSPTETVLPVFSPAWWEIFLAGVSTLAIYTFLVKENAVYRAFEHFFIGIATAWITIATIRSFFWPQVLKPLLGLDLVIFPDGTTATPYHSAQLLLLIPMSFGMLYYLIYSKRWSWLAQLVIGFQLGVSAGLAFKGTFVELLPQIFNSMKPIYIPGNSWESVQNIFFLFTLGSVFIYFFFTFKRAPGGVAARTAGIGRWLMMGCFGAFFGSTIMARMALLVERLEFLIKSWWPAISTIMS